MLWELYTVVGHADHFGASPRGSTPIDKVAPPIGVDELVAAIDDPGVLILDARDDAGYRAGHISGAVPVTPGEQIPVAAHRVIVYGADADCSATEPVARALVDAGYGNVGRFLGGVAEWKARALPLDVVAAARR